MNRNRRVVELPLDTRIDIQDALDGDVMVEILRSQKREKREETRQAIAEAAVAKPKAKGAAQGALFEVQPEGFDPK